VNPTALHDVVPHIRLDGLTVVYEKPRDGGSFVAVANACLDVERGTFVTIVGPSGCGKSSLLLAIAGLIRPAKGRVLVNGRPVSGPGRDRAMVFQDFALLPWRTVLENVRFGLELQSGWKLAYPMDASTGAVAGNSGARGWKSRNREDLNERALRYVRLVGLNGFEHYHPQQLSGGMKQKAGIARALAVDPEILLMDEPFGSLDAQAREAMGNELLAIWEQDKKTALFVTHSIDEAIFLGDRVVVMEKDPGHITETISIHLPRPRTVEMLDSEAYIEHRRRIRAHLMGELQHQRALALPHD